jgi:hypothetical protein
MTKAKLIDPYGGKLVNLVVNAEEREDLLARASQLPSIKITMRIFATWNYWLPAVFRL